MFGPPLSVIFQLRNSSNYAVNLQSPDVLNCLNHAKLLLEIKVYIEQALKKLLCFTCLKWEWLMGKNRNFIAMRKLYIWQECSRVQITLSRPATSWHFNIEWSKLFLPADYLQVTTVLTNFIEIFYHCLLNFLLVMQLAYGCVFCLFLCICYSCSIKFWFCWSIYWIWT